MFKRTVRAVLFILLLAGTAWADPTDDHGGGLVLPSAGPTTTNRTP